MSTAMEFPPRGPIYPDLRGKVAIVTGGGRGIGKAIAARLAREGVRVALASRGAEALEASAEAIRSAGGVAEAIATDVGRADQVDRLFATAAERLGPPDILVNNAAHMVYTPSTSELAEEDWLEFVATNVNGPMFCTVRAARAMGGRGGAIVNISTVGALRSHYGMGAYDITKAVTDSLTRTTGIELIRQGIRVNAVAPGRTHGGDGPYAPGPDLVRPRIPIGRAAHAEEIASVVAFLASSESSYIVGQTVCVDGGLATQLTPPGEFV